VHLQLGLPRQLCLNESDRIVKYLRVVAWQINLLPTFSTDDGPPLSYPQEGLVLSRATGSAANRLFEHFARIDHGSNLIQNHLARSPAEGEFFMFDGRRGRMATDLETINSSRRRRRARVMVIMRPLGSAFRVERHLNPARRKKRLIAAQPLVGARCLMVSPFSRLDDGAASAEK
jgi:hypothetical protein